MIATISGQAGFAVVPGETTSLAYSIDDPASPDEILPQHVDLLFRGATDVVQIDVADASTAIALLRTEWSRDRLLQMLLLLLRDDGDDEARRLAADAAEELFESHAARRFALNRLYSRPLTEDANVHAAIDLANMAGARNTSSRLRQLRDDQVSIARVSMAWKSILTVMPEINLEGRLRRALEANDIFYRLGRTRRTSDLDDLQISLALSDLPRRFAKVVHRLINAQRRAFRRYETPPVRSYPTFEHSYAEMLAARKGKDSVRFERLYQRQYARVWRYFRKHQIVDDEAHDLAQDTFKRVYERMDQMRNDDQWPFLATIAKTMLLNRIRARQTQNRSVRMIEIDDPDLIFAEPAAPAALDYAERKEEEARRTSLQTAIESLPAGQRECVRLRVQGLTYEEIANTLGISLDAVKSRLRNATRTLREQLGEKSR